MEFRSFGAAFIGAAFSCARRGRPRPLRQGDRGREVRVAGFPGLHVGPTGSLFRITISMESLACPFRLLLEGNALSGTVAAPAPTPKVADWQAGSKVPKYKVWQAAQLWVNREPTTDTIADYASPIYNRLIADLESYKLPSVDKYNLGDDQTIGPHTEIHRNDLIKYAEAANEKPKFLFT